MIKYWVLSFSIYFYYGCLAFDWHSDLTNIFVRGFYFVFVFSLLEIIRMKISKKIRISHLNWAYRWLLLYFWSNLHSINYHSEPLWRKSDWTHQDYRLQQQDTYDLKSDLWSLTPSHVNWSDFNLYGKTHNELSKSDWNGHILLSST